MKPIFLTVVLWLFSRTYFRLTVLNSGNIPAQGGGLLVSNHMSFADQLLILSSTSRVVRFLLPQEVYSIWWLRPFLRYLQVIPLPPESNPRELIRAVHQAREVIQQGDWWVSLPNGASRELVCSCRSGGNSSGSWKA